MAFRVPNQGPDGQEQSSHQAQHFLCPNPVLGAEPEQDLKQKRPLSCGIAVRWCKSGGICRSVARACWEMCRGNIRSPWGRRPLSSRPQDVVLKAMNAWEGMIQLRVEAGLANCVTMSLLPAPIPPCAMTALEDFSFLP